MHTCTCKHVSTCSWKVKAFIEAEGSARLSHWQKLMLSGRVGRVALLVIVCGWEEARGSQIGRRGQATRVFLEGGGPGGHGASGATEVCKQKAQPRPALLETADLVLLEPVTQL